MKLNNVALLVVLPILTLLSMSQPVHSQKDEWNANKTLSVNRLAERYLVSPDQAGSTKPTALSISIGVDGTLLFKNDYGFLSALKTAPTDTRYQIGSITKQMTATAVMKAIEDGARIATSGVRLTMTTPVSSIIDGVAHWDDANGKPITIKRLLTMTSQLPNFTQNPPREFDPARKIKSVDLLRALRKLKPRPGWSGTFGYNNTSYFLLAEILERVVGPEAPRPEGYRKRLMKLFDSAGMDKTSFLSGDDGANTASPLYRRRPAFSKPDWLKGSGDLISTAEDLYRWNAALMSGRILNMNTLEIMHEGSAHVSPHLWYGMGCYVEFKHGRTIVSHAGYVPGFTSLNRIVKLPKGNKWASISVLMNADEAFYIEKVADDLTHIVLSN